MTRIRVEDAVGQEDLLRLRAPVERYLRERSVDPHDVEDLAQETLARVWEARGRVDSGALPADLLPAEGRDELTAQGAYVVVDAAELRAEPGPR